MRDTKGQTVILQPWQRNMTTLNILGLVIMPSLDDGMMERYITGMKACFPLSRSMST